MLAAAERLVLKRIHRQVIAVSSELAGHLGTSREKIRVVPNGVDIDTIWRLASEAPASAPGRGRHTLTFLGRLAPVKRVDRIIDALALLDANEPGEWRLWIIGDGPERHALEQHVCGIGVADQVDFTGFLSNPLPLLKQADALVFASDHEGLPMTALEALALGVPVVAPEIGGLTELINDAGHGGLAKRNSAEELAKAISICIDHSEGGDDTLPSRLAAKYTVAETARKTMQLYANAAEINPSPHARESASA